MLSLITASEAALDIAQTIKKARLSRELTQLGIAERSGVNLASYRRFERTGKISFEGYLKIMNALGYISDVVRLTEETPQQYQSIDDVLKEGKAPKLPKKGKRK